MPRVRARSERPVRRDTRAFQIGRRGIWRTADANRGFTFDASANVDGQPGWTSSRPRLPTPKCASVTGPSVTLDFDNLPPDLELPDG